ncbi:MAG: hypothetical protein B7Z72_14815, partial [Gemmatimonadetes bacterium 21-71-4]
GVSRHAAYRLGAALLDATGTNVLARTADPIFEAVEPYEKEGEIPNVVFSCGAVVRDDTLFLYYGAADRVIGVATASMKHMLDALKAAKHIPPDVQKEIDGAKAEGGGTRLHLSDDEGMELSELLQWHVRTDPATGQPTAETAPYAEVIRLISEAQL